LSYKWVELQIERRLALVNLGGNTGLKRFIALNPYIPDGDQSAPDLSGADYK